MVRKAYFLAVFIVILMKECDCRIQVTRNWFDVEQMKNELFTLNESSAFDLNNKSSLNDECSKELNEIRNGISRFESWAMKRKFLFQNF